MKRSSFLALAVLGACGGTAVIDPPLGDGGSTSAATTATTAGTGGAMTTAATTSASNVTTGSTDPCVGACTDLYQCGLEQDTMGQPLCPGFSGSAAEQDNFVFGDGTNGCVDACHDLTAMVSLVDPDDCEGTISTFESVNSEFADACEEGF